MYTEQEKERVLPLEQEFGVNQAANTKDYRSCWRRDLARLIHCPSFRRLQGKTQLFPGGESDFFRNRLTHSLEVAQIAKSISLLINNTEKYPNGSPLDIDYDLVEFAALAHDIGHPPFGHQGEEALDKCMVKYGGFEGNAQTLRVLSKIEKKAEPQKPYITKNKDHRVGLNLTYRSLAAILKYDQEIPYSFKKRDLFSKKLKQETIEPVKGYYSTEASLVSAIKKAILKNRKFNDDFKTVECQIMDIADDFAYSTYDLEDGLKAGFLTPLEIVFQKPQVLEKVAQKVAKRFKIKFTDRDVLDILMRIFGSVFKTAELNPNIEINNKNFDDFFLLKLSLVYADSREHAINGYFRVKFTSNLINDFITKGIKFRLNHKMPALSKVWLENDIAIYVEVLKRFNYESQIVSPKLRIVEFRGKEIVDKIFTTLADEKKRGFELLPHDFREIYESVTNKEKKRVICDFVAGMTDRYAIEFYGRLTSEHPETIFKPF